MVDISRTGELMRRLEITFIPEIMEEMNNSLVYEKADKLLKNVKINHSPTAGNSTVFH